MRKTKKQKPIAETGHQQFAIAANKFWPFSFSGIDELTLKHFAEVDETRRRQVAEILGNPNADGWVRLVELLMQAGKDERIISSPGASGFVALIVKYAKDSLTTSSAEQALRPLAKELESESARNKANKRFNETRKAEKWTVGEWQQHKKDYEGNKSAFARDYAKRIWNEKNVQVTERNIRERWLKDY